MDGGCRRSLDSGRRLTLHRFLNQLPSERTWVLSRRLAARFVCAISVCCCSFGACSRQSLGAVRMPGQLQAHIKRERFQVVTSVRGLPVGVRDGMRMLWRSKALDIADPDARPNDSGNDSNLVSRRLVAAGCSRDHCLVYYELVGQKRTHRVVLFRWTPSATQFEWGGTAPAGLENVDDVLNAVVSGAIQGPTTSW